MKMSDVRLLLAATIVSIICVSSTGIAALDGSEAPGPSVLDKEFVAKFREFLSDRNSKPLEMSPGDIEMTPAIRNELYLLATEALIRDGSPLSAQLIAMDVAVKSEGTSQAAWALAILDQISQNFDLDEGALAQMAFEYDGSISRLSERAMIAWFRVKEFRRRGFSEWAARSLPLVGKDTRWYSDRLFEETVTAANETKDDVSNARIAEILKRKSTRASTRRSAELFRAREVFSKGNYAESLKTARSLDLPLREHARVLVEMAWSRYYLKQFGSTLGILKVIDSPFFESLRSPEADLLRMNVGRDLCRYDSMRSTAKEFRERYAQTFKLIDSRSRLDSDQTLKQMALQNPALQNSATLIHRYRTERNLLGDENLGLADGLREFLLANISLRERQIEAEISRLLPREIELAANELVDLRQQISSLESAALNKPVLSNHVDDEAFGRESMPFGKFDRTYWPVGTELWWDELDGYQVWMRSHCPDGAAPALSSGRGKSR